ncbi:hypothetical protein N5C51_02830 [Citrobacter freundii]|uniref:hypothetical protein n=1 Tax=Citrobacter freundii TaxID=546 RepID=UPI0024489021|nr:hypothetical protein [Citrobacter freundii]MDH0766922.1 hypothetical protein [Citrobacter freundii]MDH1967867.1 hypothetical protein [Citrobacter freundii]
MTSREKFEAFLVSEYEWGNDALNAANFHGDDATGYYTGGDFIYDGQSCSECLFWAWRGWQAAELAAEKKLTDMAVQLANAESKCRELAAENAGLKAALRTSDIPSEWTDAFGDTAVIEHDATGDNQGHSVSWSWVGNQEEVIKSVLLAVDGSIKTPATDAFLAEVRASAIRDALDESSDYLDTDCVMDRLDISYEDAELRTSGAIELHDALVAVANQLRKGE